MSPVKLRPALESMLKPFCLAILLVTAFVVWSPDPASRRPVPPPPCEVLAPTLAFRFNPRMQGRIRPLEQQALNQTVPAPCRAAWSANPPYAWDLARLDRRPRPKEALPAVSPAEINGRFSVPKPLS